MGNLPNTTIEDLKAIAEVLPKGSYARIGEMTNYSDETVRRFFKGDYNITVDNIKILDAANEILNEAKEVKASAEEKINEMLSKGKE